MTALILFRQRRVKIREQYGLKNQLERLTEKMTDMEDRCRRNNVDWWGSQKGWRSDAAGFLRANLSKWIPSLRGRDIEIDRAHRVYDGGAPIGRALSSSVY